MFHKSTLSSRGQESAPFEVLIAVIVMSFVLYFGFRALNELKYQDCMNRLTSSVEKFRAELEKTVLSGAPGKITFRPPKCARGQEIRVDMIANRAVCSSLCESGIQQCTVISVFSTSYAKRFCLKIPLKVSFPEAPGDCEDKTSEGYTLIDIRDGIPDGEYYFLNRTPAGKAFPIICVYWKG